MNRTQTRTFNKQNFLSTYQNKKPSGAAFTRYIKSLHEDGGPSPEEFPHINAVLNYYIKHLPKDEIFKIHKRMYKHFGDNFLQSATGHATLKPHGYPGDFEVMDMLYTKKHTTHKELLQWDKFFHWQPSASCILNRKSYFKDEVKTKLKAHRAENKDLHVMNIACGPGRDVFELFEDEGPEGLYFDFVDADINAVCHAVKLNKRYLPNITFHHRNIFKLDCPKQVDFIWSGGLFDYFDDTTFVKMIAKIQDYLKPGGEMIIGNVTPRNPSRGYMELFVGWFIYHRTEQELIDLAYAACGDRIKNVRVGEEAAGVNLFVHIELK